MGDVLGLIQSWFTDADTAVLLLRRQLKRHCQDGEGSLKVWAPAWQQYFIPLTILMVLGVVVLQTQFYLGCSGFYYKHWRGKFYPEKLAKKDWLNYYTKQFRTMEVNNTFYRYPTKKLLNRWYQKTPDDFKFTLKANRTITHLNKFSQTQEYTHNFYKLASLLKDKLLGILFQLPPTMHKDMALLEAAAEQMDMSVLNVLEFRHPSWWNREVYVFLERHKLVFCSVSASELPGDIVKTGSWKRRLVHAGLL